jgi:cysteine desulfuration protein SufE
MGLPAPLQELLDDLSLLPDRQDRIQALVALAESFHEVGPDVATRPFDESHRVPGCESEAFAWTNLDQEGNLVLEFAVENPQGVSAKALAEVLKRGLNGQPPATASHVPEEIVFELFGTELSMGKSLGLTNMVRLVKALAREAERSGAA